MFVKPFFLSRKEVARPTGTQEISQKILYRREGSEGFCECGTGKVRRTDRIPQGPFDRPSPIAHLIAAVAVCSTNSEGIDKGAFETTRIAKKGTG